MYRDGSTTPLGTSATTSFSDTTVAATTTYTYRVTAVDAAGNESAASATASVTTPLGSGTLTFAPSDDATVDSSQPAVVLGTNTRLTIDNSPVVNSLLKFNVTGTANCPVSSAKLKLTIGSGTDDKSLYGGDLYATSSAWSESSVTWNNAPAAIGAKVSSVPGAVALNTSYLFDVRSLVTGDGAVSVLLKSTSGDGARYYSKEGGAGALAPQLQVVCGSPSGGDTQAPSPPSGLTATATSSNQVDLTWTGSSDNIAVTGYRVYRNGSTSPLATSTTTSFSDTTASPAAAYTYRVTAVDAAGNESTSSNIASVTTPGSTTGGTFVFAPTDDATVDSSQPAVVLGGNTRLTVDNSPVVYSLLKFSITGMPACSVTSATLRLTVGSGTDDKSIYGGDLYAASTFLWSESTVTWNTAPTVVGAKVSSVSGAVALNTSYLFDVKPLVAGNGVLSVLIKSTSGDGARYYSKEGGILAQVPQLQITC